MTPSSTDRIGAISPLDSLLTQGHPSALLKAGPGFESVLNRPTGSTGIASGRTPPLQTSTSSDRNQVSSSQASDSRSEDARSVAPAPKKGPLGTNCGLKSRPDPNEEDQDRDSPDNAGPVRNDAAAPPPASTPKDSQSEQASSAEQPANTPVDADSGDGGGLKQASILDQLSGTSIPQAEREQESQDQSDAKLASDNDQVTTATPDSTIGPQPTDAKEFAIGEAAPANEELTNLATASASQATDADSQENPAPLNQLAGVAPAPAAIPEVSPADQTGEKGKDQSDADRPNNSDFSQIKDSLTSADATPSALGPSPASAQETAAGGIQVAASQPAPEPPTAAATPPTGAVLGTTSRLPSHVLAQAETRHGRAAAPVVVDSTRFLSRVAKAFLSAQQRDGEVRLRLSPPELGSLRLQVSVQDGVMVARMETETEAARASLTNNLPELRERLAEQGIRVERFDIDLMQQPSMGTPDRPGDFQQQHEPQPLRTLRTDQANSEAPTPVATPNSNWSGQGRLNVII